MSFTWPNEKPSYHLFTASLHSPSPYESSAAKVSFSVNPKQSAYLSFIDVITFRLFRSEKIDSLDTLVIPVMTARSRCLLDLNVALNRLRIKDVISCQ